MLLLLLSVWNIVYLLEMFQNCLIKDPISVQSFGSHPILFTFKKIRVKNYRTNTYIVYFSIKIFIFFEFVHRFFELYV